MVLNKLSLGYGHSRSSSQCILICHGWCKCQKHSDASLEVPENSFQVDRTMCFSFFSFFKPSSLIIDHVSFPFCESLRNSQWWCVYLRLWLSPFKRSLEALATPFLLSSHCYLDPGMIGRLDYPLWGPWLWPATSSFCLAPWPQQALGRASPLLVYPRYLALHQCTC